MPQERVRIPYPIKGISENFGFSVQEEMTCRDDRNMRSKDPRTGRLRGAQRAGLGSYAGGNTLNGDTRVLALGATSSALAKLEFTADTTGTLDWSNAGKSFGNIADLSRSQYDSYMALTDNNRVYIINEDGGVVHEVELPEVDAVGDRPFGACVAMDEFQNLFIGTSHAGNSTGDECALYIYRYNEDDTYLHVYTIGFDEAVLDIKANKNRLYVLTASDPLSNTARFTTGPAPGDPSGNTYFRLRVFEDYLPFNELPTENDDLRYSYAFQTQLTAADQGGNDSFYYTNDQNVGRLSVSEDGIVVANIASYAGITQEWGACLWLHPQAVDNATALVDSVLVSQLGVHAGVSANISGIGLEGQWTIGAVDNLDTAVTCGDPFSLSDITITATAPASGDFLDIVGRSPNGNNGRTLRLVWANGSGAGPALIGVSGDIYSIGICDAANIGATESARVDQLVAARNFAQASVYQPNIPSTTLVRVNGTTVRLSSRIPSITTNNNATADAETEYFQAIGVTQSWCSPLNTQTTFGAGVNVRRIVADRQTDASTWITDTGAGVFTQSLEGTWGQSTPNAALIRFGQDQNHNCYIPWGRASGSATYNDKAILFFPGKYNAADQEQFTCATFSAFVSAAAAPLEVPDYYDDATLLHAAFALIGGPRDTLTTGEPSIWRHNLVTVANAVGAPRDLHIMGVAGNKIVKITPDGPQDPDGNAVISTTAQYVHVTSGFQKCIVADGVNYFVYDPTDTEVSQYGSVERLRCSTLGAIPQRCKLAEVWHGRLVLARDPADPGRWSMSAIGDITDWDYFPQIPSAKQACSATNTRAGRVPDIINAVAVYSDDLLLFGGDRSIWQLTGDPMAGGSLDLITDETGMAFGRPYCKDPQGTLWFFGSTGGLYYMVPGRRPERASLARVEKALRSIDLGTNYVQLQWNPIDEGVHIFVIPFGTPSGTLVDHWFYEVNADAWHKDRFGLRDGDDIQPTASVRIDGDLYNDRTLLIGGEDGRVRRWGVDADGAVPRSDQVTTTTSKAIDSYTLFGPLIQAPMAAAQLTEAAVVLGSDESGVNYEFFAESSPEALGAAVARGRLRAGRNSRQLVRVAGDHVYMRLRNANADQTWAYETADASISTAGDARR